MKLVSYLANNNEHLGLFVENKIYNLAENAKLIGKQLPDSMAAFLNDGNDAMKIAHEVNTGITNNTIKAITANISTDALLAPVPHPTSCRDGYAFRQHVEAARRNRKVPMITEFDQYPIFYFTNHNAIQGPGDIVCMPDHFQKLDFELEVSIVIGKKGRNDQIGVYQNSYGCQIQIALQYTTGGTNYWSDSELNKEFSKTIEMNFESLMSQTIQRVNLEYQEAQSAFDKYGVKDEQI